MAEVLATLGLAVDASGALQNLKTFEAATKQTGAEATKAAAAVSAAGDKIVASTQAQATAARANTERLGELKQAQRISSDAIAEGVKRYDAMLSKMKEVDAVTKQVTDSTQAIGRAHVEAIAMNQKFDASQTAVVTSGKNVDTLLNKLRPGLASLATQMTGTNAATGVLASTMGAFAIGSAATVAILAGVSAIGFAYDKLTEKSRKQKEEQEKQTKALLDFAKAQKEGIGGSLGSNVEAAIKSAETQRKLRESLLTGGALPSGVSFFEAFVAGVTKSTKDFEREQAVFADAVTRGQQELSRIFVAENRRQESDRNAALASLVSSNRATIAERTEASNRLRALQRLESQLSGFASQGGANANAVRTQRLEVIEDIKKLNDALNPAKAAAYAEKQEALAVSTARLARELKEQAASEAAVAKSREIGQVGINAVAQLDARIAKNKTISDQQAKQYLAANEEIERLQFSVKLLGLSGEAREKLIDAENRRLALQRQFTEAQAAEFVELQRQMRKAQQDTDEWERKINGVIVAANAIASSFGSIGGYISDAIKLATQLAETLDKAAKARKAAGTAEEAGAKTNAKESSLALQGAASGAFIGFVIGGLAEGFQSISDGNKAAAAAIEEAARKLAAFNDSVRDFNRSLSHVGQGEFESARTRLGEQVGALFEELAGRFTQLTIPENGQVSSADIRKLLEGRGAKPTGELAIALESLAKSAERAEAALRREQAARVAELSEDLSVRRLRAQGQSAEAEARELELAQRRELATAIKDLSGAEGFDALIAALYEVQRVELLAAEAARALATARSIFDLTNGAQAFSDPRGARDAAFAETQQRRYADAVTRGASAAELAAIQFFNLAEALDYAAQQAENDRRTTESLTARALAAAGDTRGAEDAGLIARQRQEIADAIRDGMSPSNVALLRFTQFSERSQLQMQRAIEDGTKAIQAAAKAQIADIDVLIEVTRTAAAAQIKAIDAQIKTTQDLAKVEAKRYDDQIAAIREQTKAQTDAIDAQISAARSALDVANKQVSALDQQVATNLKVVEALKQFSDSLKLGELSTLSPAQKLAEARAQFDRAATGAAGGNADAAASLPNVASALLEASRAFNASGSGYVSDFQRVQAVIDAVSGSFGSTLPTDQQALAAAKATVTTLQAALDSLNEQKTAITDNATKQIDLLQAAKDKAAEDAQAIIDKLQGQKDAINADTQATIDKLEETKKSIETEAQRQIDALVENERRAHQDRLRSHEFYSAFLDILSNGERVVLGSGTEIANSTASAASEASQAQLTELQRANLQLTELVAKQNEQITTLKQEIRVLADGFTQVIAAMNENTSAVRDGNILTRRSFEGAAV